MVVVGGRSGLLEMGAWTMAGRLAVGQVVAHLKPLDPGPRQNEYPEGKQAEKPQAKPSSPTETHPGKLLTRAPAIQHEVPAGLARGRRTLEHCEERGQARCLDGSWVLLGMFALIPPPIRDLLYDLVARHRHRIGLGACPLPAEGTAGRFLP